MDYQSFLNLQDGDIVKLIENSIIIERNLVVNKIDMLESDTYQREVQSPLLRRHYALFLAFFTFDNPIKTLLEQCGINKEKAVDFTNFPKEKIFNYPSKFKDPKVKKEFIEKQYLKNYKIYLDTLSKEIKTLKLQHVFFDIYDAGLNDTLVYSLINDIADCDYEVLTYIDKALELMLELPKEEKKIKIKDSILDKNGSFIEGSNFIDHPAVGREEEIKKIVITLLTPEKSVILTGPAGVGKTAVVEELAYLISKNKLHPRLNNKRIYQLNIGNLLAGAKYVGDVESRVSSFLNEIKKQKDTLVFIDEIHTVIGAGKAEGNNLDVANLLKTSLARGEIKVIGATTQEEYDRDFSGLKNDPYLSIGQKNKSFGGDRAFRDRFEEVKIEEPKPYVIQGIIEHTLDVYSKKYELPVNFTSFELEAISMFLTTFTAEQYRSNNSANNPRFSTALIGKAFANSVYNENDSLQLTDIAEAIIQCDTLASDIPTRKQLAEKFLTLMLEIKSVEKGNKTLDLKRKP